MNKIQECIKAAPDIVMIGEDLKRTQVLTTVTVQSAINLLKRMEEEGINFPEDEPKIKK